MGWVYPLLAVAGLVISAWLWERLPQARTMGSERQRYAIFIGAAVGAVLGAKLGYLIAEGPALLRDVNLLPADRLRAALYGKTVTGALLGAYGAVELAKYRVGYSLPTGDGFAVLAPISLSLGRLGCWSQGCCLGVPVHAHWWSVADQAGVARWPAVQVELVFNLVFLGFVALLLRSRQRGRADALQGQLFHVYLISYGTFRVGHELLRETPRWLGPVSGYQVLALGLVALGVTRFVQRRRAFSEG
jgi:phosphatidylglycerol:prolipoprotein diacylglycerol transferase